MAAMWDLMCSGYKNLELGNPLANEARSTTAEWQAYFHDQVGFGRIVEDGGVWYLFWSEADALMYRACMAKQSEVNGGGIDAANGKQILAGMHLLIHDCIQNQHKTATASAEVQAPTTVKEDADGVERLTTAEAVGTATVTEMNDNPHLDHQDHQDHRLEYSNAASSPLCGSPTREEVLAAYRAKHRELRASRKHQEKLVILANLRRQRPRVVLKKVAPDGTMTTVSTGEGPGHGHAPGHNHHPLFGHDKAGSHGHSNNFSTLTEHWAFNAFAKYIPNPFLRREDTTQRADGWAAARINRAMRRHHMIQALVASRTPQYLRGQCKKLFDECCKCTPLVHGPVTSEAGVFQLAGPNMPKVLRILRNPKNVGLDLLQPHGIARYTAVHVAAQRGYTQLVQELLAHGALHPMESPYQRYSMTLLSRLLSLVLQLRSTKTLVSESNSELRDIISQIGVSFTHFSDALDRLQDHAPTLEDLLMICGHPLVLATDATGNTPLHYAAEGGYLSLCQLLIEYGAPINEQNKAGETPLHFAISSRHKDVCVYLVKCKANVDIARYVTLTLVNDVSLQGTFVDVPDGAAVCKLMPVLQARSNAAVISRFLSDHTHPATPWLSSWRSSTHWRRHRHRQRQHRLWAADGGRTAVVTPMAQVPEGTGPAAEVGAKTGDCSPGRTSASYCSPRGLDATSSSIPNTEQHQHQHQHHHRLKSVTTEPLPEMGNAIENGMFTRVNSITDSPLVRDRNPRDIVYFRTAPGSSLVKPNLLCVFLIGDHVTVQEVARVREQQQRSKLFHLLIRNLPSAAVIAMDSFRTPRFRCNLQPGVREHDQRWVLNNELMSRRDKRHALLSAMKGHQPHANNDRAHNHLRRPEPFLVVTINRIWHELAQLWQFGLQIRQAISVQNIFATEDANALRDRKDSVICEPKGILYEYVYDHAELRGGESATLSLIMETECKELLYHPWFTQLMDHKWDSFARQTFRRDFHIYSVYFTAFFVATYLHVGDPLLGMPIGGYRNHSLSGHAGWIEYIRDFARLIYSVINAYYTYQEYRSYREGGSLRVYFQDGWNWFDLVQITCVWMLLGTEIRSLFVDEASSSLARDYELVVIMKSYYSVTMWRNYSLRTKLMSIVGPQIFIKWIQFARGNRTLGPFVRMIFKMFKDISTFLVVYGVFLMGFGFAFFILQLDDCKTLLSAVLMVLQIGLGAWDWSVILEGGPIAIVFFIGYAIIGTIMLLNLLIAMLGNTYDKIWEDRLLFFELERAKATLSIQRSLDDDEYDRRYWCQRLYVLEGDTPIEGIQFQKF